MTRQEFLDILGRTLRRELSEQEVADNLRYYEDYMDREIQAGKSEEQVLAQLGDPRLIARTILQVDQQKEAAEERGYESRETVYTEDADGVYQEEAADGRGTSFGDKVKVHSFQIKGWLILLLVVVILFLVLGTMFAVLWKLLPVILIIAAISWLYQRFFS
ncbi:MAG: DUF1700 domain-containing protein [Lachnospiraceae bacterium]|nr:DUF1700 domain-containing protein [Lachnospiraceae bacterium]